jgi:2-methylcitrate dehydratase PrpD
MQPDLITAAFARFSETLAWQTLPEPARRLARHEVLDLLGDMVAGRALLGTPAFLDGVRSWAGEGGACTMIDGTRAPPASAVLANGYWAHGLELDDTHDAAVLHAGASVIPAALAAAELRGGCSGQHFMEAVVVGIEVMCRLGLGTRLSLVESGWIYSSLLGHFGAALAASRVLSGTVEATQRALGMAYVLTGGNHQSTREGAETKHLQPGIAGSHGVLAALMAARDVPAVAQAFLGEDGLSRVYLRDTLDADRVLGGLGTDFEIARLSFKPYPSCRLTHPAVTAALDLRQALGADRARVKSVQLRIGGQALDIVGRRSPNRLHPTRRLDAQFSIFWAVAVALEHGSVLPTHLAQEIAPSPAVSAWIGRITCVADDEKKGGREIGQCVITATLDDGRTVAASAATSLGSPENPMTEALLLEKFRRNLDLGGRSAAGTDRMAQLLLHLDEASDVVAVFADLAGGNVARPQAA